MSNLFNRKFSHIYVEEQVLDDEITKKVLSHFGDAVIIKIRHYKDVFNRPHQDYSVQKKSQSLILAKNTGTLLFKGAPVCQDFGFDRFYYTASVMNCVFDCDYCFLKGMYSTSNIVLFVNFDDYKKQVLEMLKDGPLYLCVSYDTDLASLNSVSGLLDKWIEFAESEPQLVIESRTKAHMNKFKALDNIYYAFTLSPDEVIQKFEKGTASLKQRLDSVSKAISSGAKVRLCLDPIVYIKNYEKIYSDFCDVIIKSIDFKKVSDISIGTFRISKDYLKNLRKMTPDSEVTHYPFRNVDGYSVYPEELSIKLQNIVFERLKEVFDENRIFIN